MQGAEKRKGRQTEQENN